MRRWLLQVDRPEADDLIYSRHRPHRSRHIAARKNYLALDGADDGTVLGPHIVDRTMVRTLRVMAKPKPSPNRKRRAQRRTVGKYQRRGTGAPLVICHQKSSERIATRHVSVGESISNDGIGSPRV